MKPREVGDLPKISGFTFDRVRSAHTDPLTLGPHSVMYSKEEKDFKLSLPALDVLF